MSSVKLCHYLSYTFEKVSLIESRAGKPFYLPVSVLNSAGVMVCEAIPGFLNGFCMS